MDTFKEKIIIAVGGSLLIPNAIDVAFIKHLKEITLDLVGQGYQVILVPGGGKTARNYQVALQELGQHNSDALDWVGIKTIHLNSDFLHRIFAEQDIHDVIYKPEEIEGIQSSIVVKAAFKPGSSSDMGAVRMANISGAKRIINFSNTSHVYSADPRIDPEATRFDVLSWGDYRKLIPSEWTPGMSAPFDPVASKMAQDHGLTVAILGASTENLANYLSGAKFEGTILS